MHKTREYLLLAVGVMMLAAGAVEAWGQDAPATPAVIPPNPNHLPKVSLIGDSKLPRVLLLGDSISGGYAGQVIPRLGGKALVQRGQNSGTTTAGLRDLDQILGDEPWDLIHFNWGLHDMTFQTRMAPEERGIDQYAVRLEQLAVRLKKTGAKLIWASTTPWCPEPYEYAATSLNVKLQYSAEEEKGDKFADSTGTLNQLLRA